MMALLPFTLRLTLLTSFCGLIFSGFALAGAAFTRDSGLMALAAGFFLPVAALMGRSLLRDTVELRLLLADGLWPVEADPDDLETAIVTLSAHLRDALAPGGTIAIEAQNMEVQRGTLP